MEAAARELAERLRQVRGGLLVVVTGAGVSAASGLATFRGTDPDAIWSRDVTEIATRSYFETDPVGWWRWFLARFGSLAEARPNAGHRALAALERWQEARGGFLLVTQNIDCLHEAAGSRRLIKVHGSADRVRCSRLGCRHGAPSGSLPLADFDFAALEREPSAEHLPRCPECGSLVRGHALLFDEYYLEHDDYGFRRVEEALERARALVFVGTSFSVGVTALALETAWRRGLVPDSIDPSGRAPVGVRALAVPAEELLPALCRELGIQIEAPAETEVEGR